MILLFKNIKDVKEFIKESNKNKISKEFLDECLEVSKLFKKVDNSEEVINRYREEKINE